MSDITNLLKDLSGNSEISDILKLVDVLKIPIDFTRIKDYKVTNINVEMHRLKIYDSKEKISFVSMYLPYHHFSKEGFISLNIYGQSVSLLSDYVLDETRPFFTRANLQYGTKKIIISKFCKTDSLDINREDDLAFEIYNNLFDQKPAQRLFCNVEEISQVELIRKIFFANLTPLEIYQNLILESENIIKIFMDENNKVKKFAN